MIISMSDGTYVRQQDDDPMTMISLSHRDSATAEQTWRAMEDDLNDGTTRSSNDTSCARPPPTVPVSYTERVLRYAEAGRPVDEVRLREIYGLALKKCGKHPMHANHTCQTCSSYESEKRRLNATPEELELPKRPCNIHKEAVSPTCPDCVMWAAHRNDFASEKLIFRLQSPPTSTSADT